MYAEISAAISSAKTAFDIAKAANELANFNELVAALSEVNAKLLAAQSIALASQEKQAALTARIGELEKEIVEFHQLQATKERYELHSFASGALAYKLKSVVSNPEPHHYLCAHCLDDGEVSKLQPVPVGRLTLYKCHKCGSQLKANP